MKHWANNAPMNCLHKFRLVEAERMRNFGRIERAVDSYELAIQGAREHLYLNEEAIGNELAGRFHLDLGRVSIAGSIPGESPVCL